MWLGAASPCESFDGDAASRWVSTDPDGLLVVRGREGPGQGADADDPVADVAVGVELTVHTLPPCRHGDR